MLIVDDLVKKPGSWLAMGKDTGIVISSRVRLARNLRNAAFPGWAGEDECRRLCNELRAVLEGLPGLANPVFLDMGTLDAVDKEVLKERHLISAELAAQPDDFYRQVILNGRSGTAMPAWQGRLSDQEIEDVIAFLRSKQ